MVRRRERVAAWVAVCLAVPFGPGCADQCFVFPTEVEITVARFFVKAPGEIRAVADTTLGAATCGPSPTEVVAYHWRLDDEPLSGIDGEPLGAVIEVELAEPGWHELEVRIEDDLGKELPTVGRVSLYAY